jgi:hypothetical protein
MCRVVVQGFGAVHLLSSDVLSALPQEFESKARVVVGLSIFSFGFLLGQLPTARVRPVYDARKAA